MSAAGRPDEPQCVCCFSFLLRRMSSRGGPTVQGLTQPLRSFDDIDEPSVSVSVSRPPSTDPWTKLGLQQAHRVLQEVLTTERSYVDDLSALSTNFLAQKQLQLGPIGVELATWVSSLLRVHQELLQQLEQIGPSDTANAVSSVVRIFGTMTPFLRVYTSYCAGCTRALQAAADFRGPELAEIESQCGQRLDSLLIKPVQRLCKYPLFFSELLEVLPACSAVIPELSQVVASVKQVNLEVNGRVRSAEEAAKLLQLHRELGGVPQGLVGPARRLLLQVQRRMDVSLAHQAWDPAPQVWVACPPGLGRMSTRYGSHAPQVWVTRPPGLGRSPPGLGHSPQVWVTCLLGLGHMYTRSGSHVHQGTSHGRMRSLSLSRSAVASD